jgi:hypothetical protein
LGPKLLLAYEYDEPATGKTFTIEAYDVAVKIMAMRVTM